MRGFLIPISGKETLIMAQSTVNIDKTSDIPVKNSVKEPTSTTDNTTTPQGQTHSDTSDTDSDVDDDPDSDSDTTEPTTDWKKHAREWENRSKANLKQIEELKELIADKDTTIEDLQAKIIEFEHADEIAGWKSQVAQDKGIPENLLRGDTLEDIEAHGEELKKALAGFGGVAGDSGAGHYPTRRADLSLDEQIRAAEKSGDHKLAAKLKTMKIGELAARQ
ncbi:hypothetical protein [Schaalia sp. lx-260]|uniref:hypothetical protein n=1 Tax=Schaalia sp. lx-260 TaxID=2899082 RepID=UPI001E5C7516|nr:hypothetical protein [Schaalia sp. lx-260]MCD4549683.1 hypothetical protein [Schaalia sp. lx-260]